MSSVLASSSSSAVLPTNNNLLSFYRNTNSMNYGSLITSSNEYSFKKVLTVPSQLSVNVQQANATEQNITVSSNTGLSGSKTVSCTFSGPTTPIPIIVLYTQIAVASAVVAVATVLVQNTETNEYTGVLSITINGGNTWHAIASPIITSQLTNSCTVENTVVSPFAYTSISCSAVSASNTMNIVVATGLPQFNNSTEFGYNSVFAAMNVLIPYSFSGNQFWDITWEQIASNSPNTYSIVFPCVSIPSSTNTTSNNTVWLINTASNAVISVKNLNQTSYFPTTNALIALATNTNGSCVAVLDSLTNVYVNANATATTSQFTMIGQVSSSIILSAIPLRQPIVISETGTFVTVLATGDAVQFYASTSPPAYNSTNWGKKTIVANTATAWNDITSSSSSGILCFNNSSSQQIKVAVKTSGGITGSGPTTIITPYTYAMNTYPS